MAEIHIEKKRKPIWPWILGILVIAGLIWVVMEATNRDKHKVAYEEDYTPEEVYISPDRPGTPGMERDELGMTPADTSMATGEKTQAFVAYVNETEFEEGMGTDNQVTAEGLNKLADAIEEVSEDESAKTIDRIQQTAEQIKDDPGSLQNADLLQNVMTDASETMKQIQQKQFPEMESQVSEVEKAAQSIQGDQELTRQTEEVKNFFEKAASTLNEMSVEEETMEEPS